MPKNSGGSAHLQFFYGRVLIGIVVLVANQKFYFHKLDRMCDRDSSKPFLLSMRCSPQSLLIYVFTTLVGIRRSGHLSNRLFIPLKNQFSPGFWLPKCGELIALLIHFKCGSNSFILRSVSLASSHIAFQSSTSCSYSTSDW